MEEIYGSTKSGRDSQKAKYLLSVGSYYFFISSSYPATVIPNHFSLTCCHPLFPSLFLLSLLTFLYLFFKFCIFFLSSTVCIVVYGATIQYMLMHDYSMSRYHVITQFVLLLHDTHATTIMQCSRNTSCNHDHSPKFLFLLK